jgi:hypothetical protein
MLKSIGRSSHFWPEIVGGTVSPPPVHRKTIIGLLTARFGAAMTARVAFSGPAMRLVH